MSSIKAAAAAAAMAIVGAASAATVVNGGFEDPVVAGGYQTFNAISTIGAAGWTVLQGSVDVVKTNQGWGTAYEGAQFLDLVGTGLPVNEARIQQTLTGLTANTPYQLTFWYRANAGDPLAPGDTYQASLRVSSSNAPTDVISVTQAQANTGTWYSHTYAFTPVGTSANLTFVALTSGANNNGGIFLDAVSVTPVPEPHEWVMMLAGLGMVGVIASRRRAGERKAG
jgi:hypothetical protein